MIRIKMFPFFLCFIVYSSLSANDYMFPFYKDGKYGYMNRNGSVIIEPKYDDAFDFIENRAVILIKGQYRYIDMKGNYINGAFERADDFSEGLASVCISQDLYQFIDLNGKVILPPRRDYYCSDHFKNGFIVVQRKDKKKNLMDQYGKLRCKKWYQDLKQMNDDLIPFKEHGKWGVMNNNEEIKLEPKHEMISEFQEGFAVFKDSKGYSFIDKEMNRITTGYFEYAQGFTEGMAAIKKDGKWGFINTKGEIVIKPIFYDVGSFSEGLATFSPFSQCPFYGFIDKTGKEIIKPMFEGSGVCKNGVCKIIAIEGSIGIPNYVWCYIDREGEIIWEPHFKACRISEKELEEIVEELSRSD